MANSVKGRIKEGGEAGEAGQGEENSIVLLQKPGPAGEGPYCGMVRGHMGQVGL